MKEMPPNKPENSQKEQKTEDNSAELSTTQYLVETIKRLQAENENLKLELTKSRRIPSGKIGIVFLVPGVLSLVLSIYAGSSVLAFIGLGLTFWGALFFFVRPIKYVKSSLLDSTAITSYSTIDRIIKDLNYKGKSYYIPPYPKDVYLPEYLKGLKDMIVFISAENASTMPSIEEMAKSRFILEKPKGISIAPPGLGLLTLFEKELKTDLTALELSELSDNLTKIILENFQLAKEIEIKPEQDMVHVKIVDSTYKDLYTKENLKSVHSLGDPIVSAIACAIAKTTGKMVTIQKDKASPDERIIQAWLQILRE
jgi:hypothetical protein